MNLNIRVEVRVNANVGGLTDEQTNGRIENRITILRHVKSRRDKNTCSEMSTLYGHTLKKDRLSTLRGAY